MTSCIKLLINFGLRRALSIILGLGLALIVVQGSVVPVGANPEGTIVVWETHNVTTTPNDGDDPDKIIIEAEPSVSISPISSDTILSGMNTSKGKMAAHLSVNGGRTGRETFCHTSGH